MGNFSSFGRKSLARLNGPKSETSVTSDLNAETDKAEEVWSSGKKAEAIELLRQTAVAFGPQGGPAWWKLYFKLVQEGKYDSASLALRNTLQLDPMNLGALELLIEDSAIRGPHGVVSEALDNMVKELAHYPNKHVRATAFVFPARLEEGLRVLRESPDDVVREAVRLYDEREHVDNNIEITSENALPISLFAMGQGRNDLALRALDQVPNSEEKLVICRITVRRMLRMGKPEVASKYLKMMAPMAPQDNWIQVKIRETDQGILSPYQLSRKGYPFARRKTQPAFVVNPHRILYLLHNSLPYNSAGYATRTHGLLTGVRTQGWDISGVTRLGYPFDMPKHRELESIASEDTVDGITYYRLSTKNRLEMKKPLQLYIDRYVEALEDLTRRERPFVLHAASNHWNGLAAVEAANRLGIESVYEVRGLWEVTRGSRDPEWAKGGMYAFMARMEAEAARGATRVITITNALADELVVRGVDRDKITVVPNGVDFERFTPRARNEELAASLGVSGKVVIGYIGSVLDYEGLGLLIEAAENLRFSGYDFAVLIVGDGAELERFQMEVQSKGLDDCVIFTGRVPHEVVEDYYSLVDIAPFPRLPLPVCEMVSPLKPFEAMAMQKTVVASDVAALSEIVQDGVTGLLHRKGDADDLTAVLASLLDDADLRKALASAGREWVSAERRWQMLSGKVSDIYKELGGEVTPRDR